MQPSRIIVSTFKPRTKQGDSLSLFLLIFCVGFLCNQLSRASDLTTNDDSGFCSLMISTSSQISGVDINDDLAILCQSSSQDEMQAPLASGHLQPQDRLTLIGGAMIERLQADGLLEAALYHSLNSHQFQVRNLGWSGDDVWGTARAVFGEPSDGFERLRSDLKFTKPTVVLVAYGANESFAGADGLSGFRDGLQRLLTMVDEAGANPILVTPPPFEDLGPPLPSMQIANENLALYCQVIREIAAAQNLRLIDLHARISDAPPPSQARTDNSIHLTQAGTAEVSRILADELLGQPISDANWTRLSESTDLLTAIRKKNEWYFHRYRPQNETYLFLFRKHEQGNNAAEIPQFDEWIHQAEQEIRRAAGDLSPQ